MQELPFVRSLSYWAMMNLTLFDTSSNYYSHVGRISSIIFELRPYQRKALLLSLKREDGDTLLKDLLIIKAVSLQQLMDALEVTDKEFNSLLSRLPLESKEIALYLNCNEDQVRKLIRCAWTTILRALNNQD
jgi:hypothetical protein